MKTKVMQVLSRKELELFQVRSLIEKTKSKKRLESLYKNEIEVKAQVAILRFLLS